MSVEAGAAGLHRRTQQGTRPPGCRRQGPRRRDPPCRRPDPNFFFFRTLIRQCPSVVPIEPPQHQLEPEKGALPRRNVLNQSRTKSSSLTNWRFKSISQGYTLHLKSILNFCCTCEEPGGSTSCMRFYRAIKLLLTLTCGKLLIAPEYSHQNQLLQVLIRSAASVCWWGRWTTGC